MCLCIFFGFLALGSAVRPEHPLPKRAIIYAMLVGALTDLALLLLLILLSRQFFIS